MSREQRSGAGNATGFSTGLHPVVFAGAVGFAATVCGVTALIVARNPLSPEGVAQFWLAAAAVALVAFVSPAVRWWTTRIRVGDGRLEVRGKLRSVPVLVLPLRELAAVEVEPTVAGRLLGYATVRVVTRDGGEAEYRRVARADELRAVVLRRP